MQPEFDYIDYVLIDYVILCSGIRPAFAFDLDLRGAFYMRDSSLCTVIVLLLGT